MNIMPNLTAGPSGAAHAGLLGQDNDSLERAVAADSRHLLDASRSEYMKLEKTLPPSEVEGWA